MQFFTPPSGSPTGVMVKCDTCGGNGNVPDDSGPSDWKDGEDKIEGWRHGGSSPIYGPDGILMSLLFLLLPFLGGAQELFRFTSTSQFIGIDTSAYVEWDEWHTETEVYAEWDKFVLASRSENRPHTIYYNITWEVKMPRLIRGRDPVGRVYEWHKTEDKREFNGIDWITVEGENFARIYGGQYDFRFYEDWWTLTIQKR